MLVPINKATFNNQSGTEVSKVSLVIVSHGYIVCKLFAKESKTARILSALIFSLEDAKKNQYTQLLSIL